MDNEKLKNVLKKLEADNVSALGGHAAEHRFPRKFERKALAVCGGNHSGYAGLRPARRLPFRAAVLAFALLFVLVTGCAVAAYKYFTRYIPYYGIIDLYSDIQMYATEEMLTVGDMEIETLLYIKDGNSGVVRLWAAGPALSEGWDGGEWMKTPVFTLKTDRGDYPVYCTAGSTEKGGGFYECEAKGISDFDRISVIRGGWEKEVPLHDISEKGYTVSGWAEYDGITIKILPLYANNRIFVMRTEGILDVFYASAAIKAYDSFGNSASAAFTYDENDYAVLTADKKLPGDIVKIEIDSLRIRRTPPPDSIYDIPMPAADGEYTLNIKLLDNDMFTETAVKLKRDGETLYLTTKIDAHKYKPLTDFFAEYVSRDVSFGEWNTLGVDTVIYQLKIKSGSDTISLTATKYMYMIRGTRDEPLGVIQVKKSK